MHARGADDSVTHMQHSSSDERKSEPQADGFVTAEPFSQRRVGRVGCD